MLVHVAFRITRLFPAASEYALSLINCFREEDAERRKIAFRKVSNDSLLKPHREIACPNAPWCY